MNCKDCKHWDKKSFVIEDWEIPSYGECKRYDHDQVKFATEQFAAICWSEGISGEFLTKGNFGCKEFKRK